MRKFRENSSEISSEIISCFWVKKPCFWGFWGQSSKNRVKNKGFRTFWIYGKFGICSIPNFQKITKKMTLKSNFGNREKLIPTRKPTRMFGLKFGMQGLSCGCGDRGQQSHVWTFLPFKNSYLMLLEERTRV